MLRVTAMRCLLSVVVLATLVLNASVKGDIQHDFQDGRWEDNNDDARTSMYSSSADDRPSGVIIPNKLRYFEGEVGSVDSVYHTRGIQPLDGLSPSSEQRGVILRSVDDEGESAPATGGGWGFPSMGKVKSLASSAYSSMPSKDTLASYVPSAKTVTSYLPESVQSYLPTAETLQSYMPSVDSMAAKIPESVKANVNPKQGFLSGTGVDNKEVLSADESEKLVGAMSDKILNKQESANFDDVVNEVGQNVAQRAVENAIPLMIRLVVHRVVYGMAVNSMGPVVAFLAKNKIAQVANAIADKAIDQYMSYEGPYKVDVLSFMRRVNWVAIAKNVVQIARSSMSAVKPQA